MAMALIDIARARIGDFLASRFQGPVSVSRGQTYRVFKMEPQKPARGIPLFGADPSGDFEDWASYRSSPPQGPATQAQAQTLQSELRENDENIDKEWTPNSAIPSLIGHGKKLDYSHETTDQKPIVAFAGETTAEAWDGIVRANTAKKPDFQAARGKSEPTIGDLHARDLKSYPYDFST